MVKQVGGLFQVAVAVAIAVAVATMVADAQVAYAVGSESGQEPLTIPTVSAASISFPAAVPVNGTGLITVNYTVVASPLLPPLSDGNGTRTAMAMMILRVPAGIEVISGGFEVYSSGAGVGGRTGEFAVFHAKKPVLPSTYGTHSEEVRIRVGGEVAPPRNFVDVHVSSPEGGGAITGASALLVIRGGTVHFAVQPNASAAAAAATPFEATSAQSLSASAVHALPPASSLAAHLARALPPGYDVATWLAEHAGGMPAYYREEVVTAYGVPAAGGASGTSGGLSSAFPFPPLSSYVYGTLHTRGTDGILRGQPGALACTYDVAGDNATLSPLVNLGDPLDPRGACAATDAEGFFGMSILTLDPSDPLSEVDLRIVFSADGPRARVSDAAGRAYEMHAVTVGNLSAPVRGFNVTVPDGHEFRRAMWIGDAISHAHDRLASEFGHVAPRADVQWDPASPDASSYNLTSEVMTVSSVHALGSRHGAEAVPASIIHEYAHHVLAGLEGAAGSAACTGPLRIDRPSSEECAWTDGWAHFMAAVAQDSSRLEYHGLPVAVDLEVPAYDIGRGLHVFRFAGGPDVPGNVAGVLWDLYDLADERGDAVNGNGTAV